jgi:ParB family chromosome partitioning protein
MKKGKIDLGLSGYESLFMTDQERQEASLPKVYELPLAEIDPFPEHPFKVRMDEDMDQLTQSVKERGVITPITVRQKEDGRYEIVSGHRRVKACELAGLETVRAEIKELTRDEAIILMVESNLQRSVILPSEKAYSYKMRLEAMNRQGQRTDLTSAPLGPKLSRSNEELAVQVGDSRTRVQRYIRLTSLIPSLLDQVDEGKIALRPAVELSYLTEEEQNLLADVISYMDATPSHDQAIRLRRLSEQGSLPLASIEEIMREPKPNQREQIRFNRDDFGKYFQPGYTQAQMKQDILHGLELLHRERQKENSRNAR